MRSVDVADVWDARVADRGFMVSLATLAFAALGLELVVDGTVLTVMGAVPGYYPLGTQFAVWLGLGAAWLMIAWVLAAWSRRRGVDPLVPRAPGPLGHLAWSRILVCFVAAVLAAILLPLFVAGAWGVPPIRLYLQLYTLHGPGAWLLMLAWAVSHVGRAVLLGSVLGYAHRAALMGRHRPGAGRVPWGGLVTGVLLGAIGYLVGGPAAGLVALVCSVLLGLIHVLAGESLRVTAVFAVLVYLFL